MSAHSEALTEEYIKKLEAQQLQLLEALKGVLRTYIMLVESSDAGSWDPETEPEVQLARDTIKAVEGGK